MKLILIAAAYLALTACATSDLAPGPVGAPAATASDLADSDAAVADVKQVEMSSLEELATCRRHVATGTRIAEKRCETKAERAGDAVAQQQAQQDLESMRRQQLYEEQARRSALAEAARRRSGQ